MSGEVSGQLLHCEQPVVVKSRRIGWAGDYENETVTMICAVCGADLTLAIRAAVGPPSEGSA